MLSPFTQLLRPLTVVKLNRTLSVKQFNGIKPILRRDFARLFGQPVKQTFGGRLKRRLRNGLIVIVVGVGTYQIYHQYHRHRWFSEKDDATETVGRKPRLVVLGTGWGAVPLLRHIDAQKYEVVCVSPRNYFLMTPLLPSVSVGTIETRTVIESIRSLLGPHVQYIEAHCVHVDYKSKVITCNSVGEKVKARSPNDQAGPVPANDQIAASSRVVKDSARNRPVFDLHYDVLVVAIGSENNTFNTPGVAEHAHLLKEVPDARRIRSAISDAFESAMTPAQSTEERKRLLSFVVVGGGPTGVEFAAELSDLVHEDLRYYYPQLVPNDVKITLIQSRDHILSTMDKRISEYTEKHFGRENIEVITNTRVKEVKQREVIVKYKALDELKSIPCSIAVWATGIKARPLIKQIREKIGLEVQSNRMGLLTDPYLRVKGIDDGSIFALGDCASIDQTKSVDRIQSLFEEADTEHRGALDLQQFRTLMEKEISEFPQLEMFSKGIEKAFAQADKEKSGHLTLPVLRSVLEKADKKIRALPATAQVAHQEGLYVADLLNQRSHFQSTDHQEQHFQPFRYEHMGSLAYVGGEEAVLDFSDSKSFFSRIYLKPLSGRGAAYLWKSFYFTEMFTGRTKTLLAFDWVRTRLYGRDISRY